MRLLCYREYVLAKRVISVSISQPHPEVYLHVFTEMKIFFSYIMQVRDMDGYIHCNKETFNHMLDGKIEKSLPLWWIHFHHTLRVEFLKYFEMKRMRRNIRILKNAVRVHTGKLKFDMNRIEIQNEILLYFNTRFSVQIYVQR